MGRMVYGFWILLLLTCGLGCSEPEDFGVEATPLACSDGLDNDQDDQVDCADRSCRALPICQQCGACDTPPANECDGEGRLIRYASRGNCKEGQCVYETTVINCAGGCTGGECVGEDLCASVDCESPPNDCYQSQGSCREGHCSYDYADGQSCDDDDPCTTDDSCLSGACAGRALICDQPPPSRCRDAQTLLSYARLGSCSEGNCDYEEAVVSCPNGCDEETQSCRGDPCAGVTCDTPPNGCYRAVGICRDGACGYPFNDGASCDDANPCTLSDRCSSGVCIGSPRSCVDPPASRCKDAQTLLTYASPGSCSDGQCDYLEREISCPGGCDAQTQRCRQDPCQGIACNQRPGSCYAQTGTCRDGNCSYPPLSEGSCNDGDACTVNDSCSAGFCRGTPRACLSPPASRCRDQQTLLTYLAPGSCNSGNCSYDEQPVSCPFGCAEGACRGDPCAGVSCQQPPTPCHAAVGTCSGGRCSYAPLSGDSCNDGNACTDNDRCNIGRCEGTPRSCNSPPPAECADRQTLRTYNPSGSCAAGQCNYTPSTQACPFGCANGRCLPDPCADVSCAPRSPTCRDDSTLITFGEGQCVAGECNYPDRTTNCPFGCRDGRCLPDPCAGVNCDGQAPVCRDGVLVRFGNGRCEGGQCRYEESTQGCEFGCQNGACLPDPCEGITCESPAPTCNGSTLITYGGGKCVRGQCEYPQRETNCEFGCAAGRCLPDPCANIICVTPPRNRCSGSTLLIYPRVGSCTNGSCNYTPRRLLCLYGCNSRTASCNPNPCAGVICNQPPRPRCLSDQRTLRVYTGSGSCSGGRCSYPYTDSVCRYGCSTFNGAGICNIG